MIPAPDVQRARPQLLVWWVLWGSILAGLGVCYFFLGRGHPVAQVVSPDKLLISLVGLVPLFISIVIRWLVLPRSHQMGAALVMFIIGLVLAEACAFLGLFLGGPYRDDLFLLGVLGVVQYVPFFARVYLEPKSRGFIPNN